jgi:hypothetical protein
MGVGHGKEVVVTSRLIVFSLLSPFLIFLYVWKEHTEGNEEVVPICLGPVAHAHPPLRTGWVRA